MKRLILIFSILIAVLIKNIDAQDKNLRSLGEILNPDGTFNLHAGYNGSFDPANYKMITGKNGEPRFKPLYTQTEFSLAENDNWDDRFILDGLDDQVNAISVDSIGDIYIGGYFTAINGDTPERI